jgi:phytoene/squalene synthetase
MSAARELDLYTRTARRASAQVITAYSTSFGAASRLLPRATRTRIACIYALVRVADEIVDGPAADAGLPPSDVRELLDGLEAETLRALESGFSANLVVHAFAATARETGIDPSLIRSFFASMRMDADGIVVFDEPAFLAYVHGSAEVVGVMCLRAFLREDDARRADEELEEGARRLGAAFQKLNFLRDLGDDWRRLGRSYFPGVDVRSFGEEDKRRIVDGIAADLACARAVLPRLPRGARRATGAAAELFARLNRELRRIPADELLGTRVSLSSRARLGALAAAVLRMPGEERP